MHRLPMGLLIQRHVHGLNVLCNVYLIANNGADHQLLYYWIIFMLCFLYFLSHNNNRNQIHVAGRADNNDGRAGYLTYI